MLFDGDDGCAFVFLFLRFGSLFLFGLVFEIGTNLLLCRPSICFFFILLSLIECCIYLAVSYVCFGEFALTAVIKREFYANAVPMKWL